MTVRKASYCSSLRVDFSLRTGWVGENKLVGPVTAAHEKEYRHGGQKKSIEHPVRFRERSSRPYASAACNSAAPWFRVKTPDFRCSSRPSRVNFLRESRPTSMELIGLFRFSALDDTR